MSNKTNPRRKGKKTTGTGPRYESKNPSKGSNSTHVARSRKKWKRRAVREQRRTQALVDRVERVEAVAERGTRVQIPVAMLEFHEGGDTFWIHSPRGCTVMRIKLMGGKITTEQCDMNPSSHVDLVVNGDAKICLSDDVQED